MRKTNVARGFIYLVCTVISGSLANGAEPKAEKLWPKEAPGTAGMENKERIENRKHQQNEFGLNRSISAITVPTITIYPADEAKNSGIAVVICPGGGYSRVVVDMRDMTLPRD